MGIGPLPLGLILKLAQYAQTYLPKLLHMGDEDQSVRDLGKLMQKQKDIITKSDGPVEAVMEIWLVMLETKLFTKAAKRAMKIDGTGKSDIEIYQEIIDRTKAKGSDAASDIERTIDWTKRLYSNPAVQEVLAVMETEVERGDGVLDIPGHVKMLKGVILNLRDKYQKFELFLVEARKQHQEEERIKEEALKRLEAQVRAEAEKINKGDPAADSGKSSLVAQPVKVSATRKRGGGGPGVA